MGAGAGLCRDGRPVRDAGAAPRDDRSGARAGHRGDRRPARVAAEQARLVNAAGLPAVRLIGHGLAATLALEVARSLTEAGGQVEALVLVSPWRPAGAGAAATAYRVETGAAEPDEGFAARLSATVRHEPTLYAGDLTVLRPAGEVPYDAEELEFWADLCLGDVRTVEVDGDHRTVLGAAGAALAALDPEPAR
ncbi:thioesterase domain-containing protein [Micromonospora tarapacensis]|uniref:thioesterase domain-containing protein n=1 Tax=Micromonospora tarapacensis TaxID=2835305 RepID=UPI002F415D6A